MVAGWAMSTGGTLAQDTGTPTLGVPRLEATGAVAPAVVVPIVIARATDFAVEVTDDLETWRTLWNFTHRDATNVLSMADGGPTVGQARFFRLRIPGDSVEDRLATWTSQGITAYRFHYEPRIGFCNCITSAMVTVRDGVVTQVSDAKRATGFPEPSPNLEDFMSIEQAFDLIRRNQKSSDNLWVRVGYDATDGHPTDVLLGAHPDKAHGFTISHLEIIQR